MIPPRILDRVPGCIGCVRRLLMRAGSCILIGWVTR